MKTLVLLMGLAGVATATDVPAKYEAATGTSVASGMIYERANTAVSLRGDSAAILYRRLNLPEETLAADRLYVKRARQINCVRRIFEGKTEFECGFEIERNGELVTLPR